MQNIFAGYGKIVTGELYIHRKALESELCNRTIKYDTYGSVSVVGMQRMGKSSLVYNTIVKKAEDYYDKGIVIINFSMNNFANPEAFLKGIVDIVYEALEYHNDIDDIIEEEPIKASGIPGAVPINIVEDDETFLERDRPKPDDYNLDIEKELENKFDQLFGSLE